MILAECAALLSPMGWCAVFRPFPLYEAHSKRGPYLPVVLRGLRGYIRALRTLDGAHRQLLHD